MGSKTFLIFSYTLFILISLVFSSYDPLSQESTPSVKPFGFLQNFTGSSKGQNINDLRFVKRYFYHFGYINNNQSLGNDYFDDTLESAIIMYQENYHLNVTGSLDAETISIMMKPRCGVPDIMNGTNWMETGIGNVEKPSHSSIFKTVAHYAFFPGYPRWDPSKYHLTYAFRQKLPEQVTKIIGKAFKTWAKNTHFKFKMIEDYRKADIKIEFVKGHHGDVIPFGGPGGTLAHAYSPEDGRFHLDADEKWVVGSVEGGYDLETVALHEIGHLLGLEHSSVPAAIMYPTIISGTTKGLNEDDIRGIQALYNM